MQTAVADLRAKSICSMEYTGKSSARCRLPAAWGPPIPVEHRDLTTGSKAIDQRR